MQEIFHFYVDGNNVNVELVGGIPQDPKKIYSNV